MRRLTLLAVLLVAGLAPAVGSANDRTLHRCHRHHPRHHYRYCRRHHFHRSRRYVTGWQSGTSSWYTDGGQTASGWHARYGFADCGSGGGPCWAFGTRVKFCYHGCVVAVADDHGPYISGRSFDLGESSAQAIGLTSAGVATVRYRVIRYG